MICLLKDRKGRVIVTKCERTIDARSEHATVWHTDVSCPDCLALMEQK